MTTLDTVGEIFAPLPREVWTGELPNREANHSPRLDHSYFRPHEEQDDPAVAGAEVFVTHTTRVERKGVVVVWAKLHEGGEPVEVATVAIGPNCDLGEAEALGRAALGSGEVDHLPLVAIAESNLPADTQD